MSCICRNATVHREFTDVAHVYVYSGYILPRVLSYTYLRVLYKLAILRMINTIVLAPVFDASNLCMDSSDECNTY